MYDFSLVGMRHRDLGTVWKTNKTVIWQSLQAHNEARSPQKQFLTTVNLSIEDQMWDVVTKDFAKRSIAGEIFNNPMLQDKLTYRMLPVDFSAKLIFDRKDHNGAFQPYAFWYMDYTQLSASISDVDTLRTLNAPVKRLRNVAITAAYAGVSATEQNAILWLGEFRETIAMFKDIGAGLLALYKKTAKQRKAWAQGKLNVTEAQSLTLALLYGILPLEQSITQVLEGLFKLKEDKSRQTSRGFQVYTDQSSIGTESISGAHGEVLSTVDYTESLEVSVRAGVLYNIDLTDIPTFLVVANPKAITETLYAITRMSFVIDWFINVGSTIAAWSPSTGTNILSAWVSVEETYRIDGSFGTYIRPTVFNNGNERLRNGASYALPFSKEYTTKYREPIDRSDLAIFPQVNINLDLDKILAMVLLFSKVKKP